MQKFFPVALLAILIVGCKGGDTTAATTGGSGASTDKAYTLKISPKQGEKFNYDVKVTGPQTMEMGMLMDVTKVEGDKTTLVMSIESAKMDGKPVPQAVADAMKNQKTTIVMDSTGKVVSTTGQDQGFSAATFPTKPVKVGDEWEASSGAAGKELKAKYKFVRVENVGGKDIAVFEVTPEATPDLTLDGPMTLKVDTTNGMTHEMNMKMKMKGADGKEVVSSMEMKQR